MKRWWSLAVGTSLFFAPALPAVAGQFDHSSYDTVLRHYVDDEGLVDYDSIRQNSMTALESYFERLAEANPKDWSTNERLAFWINAYNARVLYLIAERPKLRLVSDDMALFDKPFKVAGRMLTLNDIEHRILRDTKNDKNGEGPIPGLSFSKVDPRIHFALVNGTVSCPTLRNFAYTAENINVTLQVNAAAFANSYKYVAVEDGHLKLSSLLKWYADDFASVGGVQHYLMSLLSPEQGGDADAVRPLLERSYGTSSFTYDWSVNEQSSIAFKQPRHIGKPAPETRPDILSVNNPTSSAVK